MNKFFKALMLTLVLVPCTFLFVGCGCGEVTVLSSSTLEIEYLTTTYDGTEKKPSVEVKIGTKVIDAKYYTVTYANNINVGEEASVTVTGKDGYTGTKAINFEIEKLNLATEGVTITLQGASFEYTSEAIEPAVSVVVGEITIPSTEYNVAYTDNTNPGTATITITGKNTNVMGTATTTFTITGGDTEMTAENTGIVLVESEYEYTGSEIIAEIESIVVGTETLTADDYIVSYSNNTEAGTAIVTIKGKGDFKGTVTTEFQITAKNLTVVAVAEASVTKTYDGTTDATSLITPEKYEFVGLIGEDTAT
ncbi:MAG: hypothetical protein PHX09_03940, partial [Clostridia bacterium]|nr:hypothetical protein [Clostridia bacterium]